MATVWTCHELTLNAGRTYAHPVLDVGIEVTYRNPNEDPVSVRAFWDGDSTYRSRVALPSPGTWTYEVLSSDPASPAHGQTGTVEVAAYAEDDPFQTRGWLTVSEDKRFLTHADGTPFFWLGDTAWEMATSSSPEQVQAYIADRRDKGFSMVQVVVSTHFDIDRNHTTNQRGEPYLLREDLSLPNPRYFDHLDEIVRRANDAGMSVSLVPLWGHFARPHEASTQFPRYYGLEQGLAQAEYIGARYAGSNVQWFIGGDQLYDTEEKREYWDAFARALDAASGRRHLLTVHPAGYSGSFMFWPEAPDWLDFHTYQASHISDLRYLYNDDGSLYQDEYNALYADGGFSWTGALRGYYGFYDNGVLPVLNVEANYEDIFTRFWERRDLRVDANAVRQVAYWGLLSGSTVGFTYGGNGVWSWTREVDNPDGGFGIRYPVDEALSLPGSFHMAAVRAFAEAHEWYRWVPRPDLAEEVDTDHFVAAATWGDRVVAYAPSGSRRFRLTLPAASATHIADITWTNAVSGDTLTTETTIGEDQTVDLTPPSDADWLAVARLRPGGEAPGGSLALAGPNPSTGGTALLLTGGTGTTVDVQVIDMLGRVVAREAATLGEEAVRVPIPRLAAGMYVCVATFRDGPGPPTVLRRSITIVR